MFKTLRIEIDGHFHGSSDVPKPWVAQIDGVDLKYGLARTFVQQLRDYTEARRAWSGNKYGIVAAFPLHDGRLYEVSRLRGTSSKRHVAREFLVVGDGKICETTPAEALRLAEPYPGPTIEYSVPEGTSITRIEGIGSPTVCGFVLVGSSISERLFVLRENSIYQIATDLDRRLLVVEDGRTRPISQRSAAEYLFKGLADDS